ncbi:MAG TPA: histidine kinase dimerization/phosphoacceptor domain -containing protein [Balneolaceae bacterium]|nr:histidine kinase dimerization/phosphoacceptor domain -containing protein [Balneolaceae bacterium]
MGLDQVDDFSFLMKAYLDFDGRWKKASASFCDFLGYTEKELFSIKLSYVCHPEDVAKCRKLLSKSEESFTEFDTRFIHKSGKIVWANIKAAIVNDKFGDPNSIAIYATDITRYKNSEPQLELQIEWIQQFLNWHHLVENSPLPVLISIDGVIKFVNKSLLQLFGFENEKKLINKSLSDLFNNHQQRNIKNGISKESPTISEQHFVRASGAEVIVEARSLPVEFEGHQALQTVLYDITKSRQQLKQTTHDLKEKETLLQEIHHRVKNNLAVISGLLELQVMNTEETQVKELLRESQLRIQSMALIHEKLYQSTNLSDIAFDNYARDLVDSIVSSYQNDGKKIMIHYDLDEIELDVTKAIPAALVLNELVSNCYKHAFTGKKDGDVKISIKKVTNEIMMSVSDNGLGIPDNFSMQNQDTLGMKLINKLSTQLNGEITFESINGTTFTLNFPDAE